MLSIHNTLSTLCLVPLQASPIPFTYLNNDLECLFINPAFSSLFNLPKQEEETRFLENAPINLLTLMPRPEKFQSSGKGELESALLLAKQDSSSKVSWFYFNKNHQITYVEISFHYTLYEGKDLYACYIKELDNHEQNIMRADHSIALHRDFIESMPLFSHVWDENLNLIDCGDTIIEMFDLVDKDSYLENFMKFSPEFQPNGIPSKELAILKLRDTLAKGKTTFEWTHIHPKTGQHIPCEVSLIRTKKDGKIFIYGYLNDRREHFRAQAEINKAYEMFQMMRDIMPISSFLFTPDYKLVDCNQEIERVFKTTKEDYLTNYKEYIPEFQPDGTNSLEKGKRLYEQAVQNGYAHFEWLFLDKEGCEVPTDLSLHRVHYRGQEMFAAFAIDLRESKKFTKKIQEEQEKNKLILNSLPIGTVYWDENHEIVDCNEAMLKLFKVESLEEYKKNFAKFTPKKQRGGHNALDVLMDVVEDNGCNKNYSNTQYEQLLISETFKNGYTRLEYERVDNEGKPLFVDVTAIRLEQDGKPFVAVYTVDLTAIKISEQQIIEASDRVQIMFDAFPMSAKLWNKDLRILDCNLEAIRVLNYDSKEEYMRYANTLESKNLPKERQYYKLFFEKVAETFETGYTRFEWVTKDKNKNEIPVEVTCIHVIHNNETRVISYLRDLREQKQMIKNLQEATGRMQIMFNTFPMGANFWNKELQIIDCNLEVVKLSGFSTKTEYLKHIAKLTKNSQDSKTEYDHKIGEVVAKAFKSGYEQLEWVTIHKEGYEIPVERTFIREKNEKGEDVVIGYMRDLREQKKMMQELVDIQEDFRKVKELAERNANIKSEFLAHMSHEIRTPMNGVIGLLHLLLDSNLVGLQQDYAEKTLAAAKHLLRIVNDILDLSSIEKGKLNMENEAFNVENVCQALSDLFKPQVEEKQLTFSINMDQKSKGQLLGDAFRLQQVLFNLVSNALKFTEEGGISIDISCTKEKNNQKTLLFQVKDTGIGLSEEQLSKLFSAFSQAESFITRKYAGTGLGLLLSKSIIEAMQGEIWVESEFGHSSTFAFTIICDVLDVNTQALEKKSLAIDTTSNKTTQTTHITETGKKTVKDKINNNTDMEVGKKVLLVEDNKINQLIANELLKKHGYQTRIAENGQEALDILEKESFDIILMDIQMPIMDGLTATKEIRKISKFNALPIIAVSAHTMEGDKEICLQSGMNDHVKKPISPPELFKAMETCLAFAE